jgi:hypothetical protein
MGRYLTIFDYAALKVCADETLPPDHIKLLSNDTASVFRLNFPEETSTLVAKWPEKSNRRWNWKQP